MTELPAVSCLAELVELRAERAGAACFVAADGSRSLSYADLRNAAQDWRAHFSDRRLPAGPIGLAIGDPLEFARAFVGLLAAGARIAPLDPAAPAAARAEDAADLGLVALLTDDGLAVRHSTRRDSPLPDRGGGASVLLRSSGTTGRRKQILLGEHQLLHTAGTVATHHELRPQDRGLCTLPLFHVNAEVVGLLSTLVAGASLVLDDRFHRSTFWPTAIRTGVTWINAVPAILAILSREPAPPGIAKRIRFARSASAPLPTAVLDRFEAVTGIPVLETYGMTEGASQLTANPLRGPRRAGSVGLPVGCELRVVDQGRPVRPGITGSVEVRGPGVVPGPLPDRWLVTGDLGYLDGDGYLFLTGRVDDVINRGGEKIFPRTIEEVLLEDDAVADAVAVGVTHDVLGSVPVACVTPTTAATSGHRPEPAVIAAQLRALVENRLARNCRPVRIDIVPGLPTGPTGKISRRLVRESLDELAAHALASA